MSGNLEKVSRQSEAWISAKENDARLRQLSSIHINRSNEVEVHKVGDEEEAAADNHRIIEEDKEECKAEEQVKIITATTQNDKKPQQEVEIEEVKNELLDHNKVAHQNSSDKRLIEPDKSNGSNSQRGNKYVREEL